MPSRPLAGLHLDLVEPPRGRTHPPVLCLHGLFAGGWVYERFLPLLAERGYPATALTFRGHPPSAPDPKLGQVSIGDFVDDAARVANELGRPIIIGHSLGGLVAQLVAARGYARAVVLVDAAPPRGIPVLSGPLLVRIARYLPALLLSRPFLPTTDDLDALVLNRVPAPERAAIRDRFVPDSGRVAREAAIGRYAVPAADVRVPVLVVSGDDDRFVPIGIARRLARRYSAPLVVAEGHGHFVLGEPGWEATAARILDWLDALPAGGEPAAAARD